ncbi:hypothetical protein AAFF_G00227900 [Aldrovandia affinis]|uniref:Uncharacterized protein n=1 Tax=Aldrovandia affinis TaxID=143900 RepID=A0AAD7TBK6_9TELE|nr:hypothetical protein AAFF_G00227900 [Aldrovandia affinis]
MEEKIILAVYDHPELYDLSETQTNPGSSLDMENALLDFQVQWSKLAQELATCKEELVSSERKRQIWR